MSATDPKPTTQAFRFTIPGMFATVTVLVSFYLLMCPPAPLSPLQSRAAAISLFAIGFWATEVIPIHVTVFVFFLSAIFMSIAPPEVVFSGFESTAIWLIFGGLILGVAIRNSGLARRIAGTIAAGLEHRGYYTIIGGVVMLGMILGFIMPSAMGRLVLLIPIAHGFSRRCGFQVGSRGRTAIILAATFGATLPAIAILPSNLPNMVLVGTADTLYRIPILYGEYLLLHYPFLGLVKGLCIVIAIVWLYPDKPQFSIHSEEKVKPLSADEVKLCVILTLLLALWMTDFLHHISPAWVTLSAAVLLLLPRYGVVSARQFNEDVNYESFFFVAGVLGLGAVVSHSGLGDYLARYLITLLPLEPGHGVANYISLVLTSITTGIATTAPGVPVVMSPLAQDMALAAGLPIKTVLMSQVVGYATILLPYQAPPLVVGMQLAGERMQDAIKLSLVLFCVSLVVLLPINYLWWKVLGWI